MAAGGAGGAAGFGCFGFAANGFFIASPNFSMVLFLRGRSSCGGGAPSRGRFFGFVANGGGGALALAGGGARLFFFLTLLIDGSLPPRRDGGGGADERGAEKVRWRFFIKMCRRRALCLKEND